jgi:hypothetical protein
MKQYNAYSLPNYVLAYLGRPVRMTGDGTRFEFTGSRNSLTVRDAASAEAARILVRRMVAKRTGLQDGRTLDARAQRDAMHASRPKS